MAVTATATALPLVEPLHPAPEPERAFLCLSRLPGCLFLDSALRVPGIGRYSFLTADPFETLTVTADGGDGLTRLEARRNEFRSPTLPGLPPFQGGAAGLFSYDLGRSLERLPRPRYDEFRAPALAVGLYDVVAAFDHQQNQAWLISHGWPESDPQARRERAASRLREFREWLSADPPPAPPGGCAPRGKLVSRIDRADLAPQFPVAEDPRLTSNLSPDDYRRTIRRAVEYIHAGDVFQVNLAQRLLYPQLDDSVALYLRLRKRNPATFAGYFDLGEFQILSASPERFVQVAGGRVEARPIKGTRLRTARPEADLFAADELQTSEKDRAENVMIVDLLRNDLSRVCRPDSVRVTQLCGLESYAFVQHLVSVVQGELAESAGPLDLLRAAFPGGSITGAPKVRAMEIIAELEPTARGPYCGSLGYLGFDGTLDLSILIRTITAGKGWWQFPVGGGIVARSDPQLEYEETWHKARGMIRALH